MKYKTIVTPTRSLAIIGLGWMASTLLTTFPLMTFDTTAYAPFFSYIFTRTCDHIIIVIIMMKMILI